MRFGWLSMRSTSSIAACWQPYRMKSLTIVALSVEIPLSKTWPISRDQWSDECRQVREGASL